MASQTSAINVNVPKEVKAEANALFDNLGITMSVAINMFLKKSIYERGIPFEVKEPTPGEDFLMGVRELNYAQKNIHKYDEYNNVSDLKEALDVDEYL